MHKVFYASGFLYNPSSQKILLQQTDNQDDAPLTLFSDKFRNKEDAPAALQRVLKDELHLTISRSAIHPVYDYSPSTQNESYFICYAEVDDALMKKLAKIDTVKWIPLEKLQKVKITPQTRQDITVGQRVINLAERLRLEKNEEKTNPQK